MTKNNNSLLPDPDFLLKMVEFRMPFGKYKGRLIVDLPENYLVWFKQKGWPEGKLGEYLQTAYEIRLNGLESLIAPLRKTKY